MMGLGSRASVIKLCLTAFLADFEARGVAALPMDWKELLRSHDGRVRRFQMVAEARGPHSTVIVHNGQGPVRYGKPRRKK